MTASLVVYDVGGRSVRTLFRGHHEAGRSALWWDLREALKPDRPTGYATRHCPNRGLTPTESYLGPQTTRRDRTLSSVDCPGTVRELGPAQTK